MRYRLLGRTGLRVSELFLGAMAFGQHGGGASTEVCRRMLDLYADAGGNVLDTAVNYRDGESETVLGQLLQGRRDHFVVGTKYTWSRAGNDPNAAGNHRKNLMLSLETSLRRLRTDYIDLYWVHVWDQHTPVEEMMQALDDATRAGKILYIGISNAPAWVIARANALAECRGTTPFAAVQVPYSLLNRDVEREILPMAETLGLTAATWGPLAHGILSGRYTSSGSGQANARDALARLSDRERTMAETVQAVADDLGTTPARVALAWPRARSRAVHPIVGASTAEQLRDNLGALELDLPADAVRRLEAASEFTPGYPADFITTTSPVFGEVAEQVDGR